MINVALKKRPQKRLGDKGKGGFGRGGKAKADPKTGAGAAPEPMAAPKEIVDDLGKVLAPEDHHEDQALKDLDNKQQNEDTKNIEDQDLTKLLSELLADRLPPELAKSMSPIEVTEAVENLIDEVITNEGRSVTASDRLDLQTFLLNEFFLWLH